MLVNPLNNLPPESDFKCLGKAREIAHARPLNYGNILEAYAPDVPIIQARFDGYDVPCTQFLGHGTDSWTLVHFQPEAVARAVKKALHPTTHLARLVPLLDEKLLNRAVNLLAIHSRA